MSDSVGNSENFKSDPQVESTEERLPPAIESEIARLWHDNAAAAHMTRTIARAMSHLGEDEETIRETIRNHGRVVE